MGKGEGSGLCSSPAVTMLKTLLTVFNFIFWISGIVILALGIWTKVDLYRYMELSSVYHKESPYVLIIVGAVIIIAGSFGCCCTFKGNAILLYLYAVFLIIVFVTQMSSGIAGLVYKKKLEGGFDEGLTNALKSYGNDSAITKAFDGLQEQLDCCGRKAYSDWFSTSWEKSQATANRTNIVPQSCCRGDHNTCGYYNLPEKPSNATLGIYVQGCYAVVTDFMESNMGMIGGVALGISFFQLLGAILACCLAKSLNRAKYEQVK